MFVAFSGTVIQIGHVTFFQRRGSELEFRLQAGGSSLAVVRFADDDTAQKAFRLIVESLSGPAELQVVDLRELPVRE
jgi:hypothetical protein